jgi:hypothetical protein
MIAPLLTKGHPYVQVVVVILMVVLVEAAFAALCALVETMMGREGEVAGWQRWAHYLLS